MSYYGDFQWKPYVRVADRRRKAEREMEKLKRKGHPVAPVVIDGRAIAKTFWGKSWCDNLEHYSDYANRIPRGRTYVRNGSVVDLQIAAGEVTARVSGSELYRVSVKVASVPKARWTSICADCTGAIDSLVELLQGRFSKGVMERLCQQKSGLFPTPSEIEFSCSCPDWASMCKHVAAVLYGIGARLDEKPELLFRLRQVDEKALITHAGKCLPLTASGPKSRKLLVKDGLSELFGIDLGDLPAAAPPASAPMQAAPRRSRAVKRKASKPEVKLKARRVAGIEAKPRRKAKVKVPAKTAPTTKPRVAKTTPKAKPRARSTAAK
jgi:uncharacterized Zn finger protein